MELGVAHVAEIPEQVGAHAEDDVPERALLAAVPELAELVAHELLVVEVGVGGAARGLAVQHPRGVRPLLVGERGAHHVPPELAPVRGLHPRPDPGAPASPPPHPQQERDGADGEQDPAGVVPRVQPARRHGERGPQRRGEAVAQPPQGAAEQHPQRQRAAQRRGRADREHPHRRLAADRVHGHGRADGLRRRKSAGGFDGCKPRARWAWRVGVAESGSLEIWRWRGRRAKRDGGSRGGRVGFVSSRGRGLAAADRRVGTKGRPSQSPGMGSEEIREVTRRNQLNCIRGNHAKSGWARRLPGTEENRASGARRI